VAPLPDAAAVVAGVRRVGHRPDLVHAHVFTAALAAVPTARLLGVPLVVSEHYSGFARGDVPRRARAAASVAYRAADAVCPVSASLWGTLAGLVPAARTRVMPNPVDEGLFALAEPGPTSGPARILVVASLVPVKGVDGLIDAVGIVAGRRRDFRLTVIGDGPQRAAYERRVGDAGLGELVRLVGRRTRHEVARAMQEADLCVAPSRWETFSVAVAEALCRGLPVLATRVGALPELVDETSGVLVAPDDPAALADGLDGMLEALGRFDRLAISRRAVERWGARNVGARWSELYLELAARKDRRR
jgi:glycosyltransferase involved in cell wall biosynthesis